MSPGDERGVINDPIPSCLVLFLPFLFFFPFLSKVSTNESIDCFGNYLSGSREREIVFQSFLKDKRIFLFLSHMGQSMDISL